jgi:hypothetical protein
MNLQNTQQTASPVASTSGDPTPASMEELFNKAFSQVHCAHLIACYVNENPDGAQSDIALSIKLLLNDALRKYETFAAFMRARSWEGQREGELFGTLAAQLNDCVLPHLAALAIAEFVVDHDSNFCGGVIYSIKKNLVESNELLSNLDLKLLRVTAPATVKS